MTIRELSEVDLKVIKALRHVAPWFVGLIVIPVLTWFFRLLWAGDSVLSVAVIMLLLVGAGLTWLSYHRTHARSSMLARWISPAYTAIAMGFLALATAIGFGDVPDGVMFVIWLIGTGGLSLTWNWHHARRDSMDITYDVPKAKVDTRAIKQAAMQALPSAAAPAVLPPVEGEVISDVTVTTAIHPEVAKAIAKVNAEKAVMEAKAAAEAVNVNARRVIGGWKELVGLNAETGKASGVMKKLARCSLKVTRNEDYCTELQLRLSDGVEPHHVSDFRGALAGKYRVGVSDVRIIANRKDNSDVKVRVVWFNPLEKTIPWQGPQDAGIWWGSKPIVFGRREDNTDARLMLPSNKKFGKPNSSHVLIEGVNGSGKSETMLVTVGEGMTQKGVCFWGIDIGKVLQTFGPIMPGIDWMITDKAVAKIAMKAIIEAGLPSRGALFGRLGAKEWTPELAQRYGIPYIVLFVEEGGLIFEALGRDMTKTLMLARSLGFCIWGSLQRAQHENIDPNARSQFTEVMTFGMERDEDIFAMPDWLQEMGADPTQWGNGLPGMHYHKTPLIAREDTITPQRSFLTDPAMLRRVADEHGPNMMRPEKSLVDALNRWELKTKEDFVSNIYADRETGLDVERRLKAAGGVELDDRAAVEAATGGQPEVPPNWTVGADGVMSPELAEATARRGEELRAAGLVPQQRERIDLDRTAAARQAATAATSEEETDLLEQWAHDDEEALDAEKETQMEQTTAAQGDEVFGADDDDEEGLDMDVDEVLAELESDLYDDEEFRASLEVSGDEDDPDGFAGDEGAATNKPSGFTLNFDDPDWDPKPSHADKEAARRNLLRVLAGYGPNYTFRAADLYDHPEVGYVNRSDSWIRGAVIDLAEDAIYIELIDEPGSRFDGFYRTTTAIERVPRPPVSVS